MKKARKYLKISWGMTLIILIMWLIADRQIFRTSNATWKHIGFGGYCSAVVIDDSYVIFETFYGLGQECSINTKTGEAEFAGDETKAYRPTDSNVDLFEWNWGVVPAFRMGWGLICLLLIQFVFLIRISPRKTRELAQPVEFGKKKNRLAKRMKTKTAFQKTRFLVPPVGVRIVASLTLLFSIFFVFVDCFYVFAKDYAEIWSIGFYAPKEYLFLDIEYILPSIVYLSASALNFIYIEKYINKTKEYIAEIDEEIFV